MKLPNSIPHSIKCPCCVSNGCDEQLAKLEWQKYSSNSSEHLSYYCDNCKNGWTTNESDELSFKYFQNKERSINRKNKINKINEL
jgi:hypothetical protein